MLKKLFPFPPSVSMAERILYVLILGEILIQFVLTVSLIWEALT